MTEQPDDHAIDAQGTPSARILIIDDDPQVRSLLRTLLKSRGYGVEEFGLLD
jgi:CheY-like chemotaxis protein